MKLIIKDSYEECCKAGAQLFIELINRKKDALIGLATGDTPKGLYKELINANSKWEVDFSNVRSVNLDEYKGLAGDHNQSYRYFMKENLFKGLNIKPENITIADGLAETSAEEKRMREFFAKNNVDMQLLGIGRNGHVGFNEPAEKLQSSFHYTDLTQDTIEANSRMFDNVEDVPKGAYTMGMGDIMRARQIVLLAFGASKVDAMTKLLKDDYVDPMCPATVLKMHPDVTVIIDRELAGLLGL